MVLGNTPEAGVRRDLRPGIADVLPGDADAAGPGTHFVSHCSKYTDHRTDGCLVALQIILRVTVLYLCSVWLVREGEIINQLKKCLFSPKY